MIESHPVEPTTHCPPCVSIVGTLPPLRAISSYCEGLAVAMARYSHIEFFSFRALYPGFLYPGDAQEDSTASPPIAENLHIHRDLTWYNPLSWLSVGMRLRGRVLNLQWWSLPLAPILITLAVIAKLRGIPVLTTVHNIEPHGGHARAFRLASRVLFWLSDRMIVHSRANAEDLMQRYGTTEDQVFISRMGIADFANGRPIHRQSARQRLSLAPENPVLLMFGAVRDYKGLNDALEAMVTVITSHPDTLLLVAGQAWRDIGQYTSKIRALGLEENVRLDLRYVPEPDIHDYFSAADILLLPYTNFRAQSGAGTSALAYGMPAIVSRCGSLTELVIDPASVIEPGNCVALANRVIEILGDDQLFEKLRKDALELAQRHTWDAICTDLCTEYSRIIAATAIEDA